MPNTRAGHYMGIFMTGIVIMMDVSVWVMSGFGFIVRKYQDWFFRPERKPPDKQNEWERSERRRLRMGRRRLLQTLVLLSSMPEIVRCGSRKDVAFMSADSLKHLTRKQAESIRRTLRDTKDEELLQTLQAITGVCDSGASNFSTYDENDFIPGSLQYTKGKEQVIEGIAGGLTIEGRGTVRYEVVDSHGVTQVIEGPGLLIRQLPTRLLPPQKIMPTNIKGYYRINGEGAKFIFANNSGVVNTPFNSRTGLPTMTMFRSVDQSASKLEYALYNCVVQENNQNLSPTQRETLRWHWRLGHANMATIRWLGTSGMLGRLSKRLAKAQETPMCATCQYGKQVRRSIGTFRSVTDANKIGGITKNKLEPGQEIAVDQFEVEKRGRKFYTKGKEKETEKFYGGTIFVDIATGFTKVYFQVSLGSVETLRAKHAFEREAELHGVRVKNYRTDNGVFTKEEFMDEIMGAKQGITVSGVGAHHQNGCAERGIRTVVTKARSMLLHAKLRWPDETSDDLWPMAMGHASNLNNLIPNINEGLSPEEKFARSFKRTDRLINIPVWGCPTYVLQPTLQDGKKLPKWQPRSRRAQFVGWSPLHASNVALVRNLTTGSISPQFHVVFDNWFETISVPDELEEPPVWDVILTRSRFEANVDPEDLLNYDLADEWLSKEELTARRVEEQRKRTRWERTASAFKKKKMDSGTPVDNQVGPDGRGSSQKKTKKVSFSDSRAESPELSTPTPPGMVDRGSKVEGLEEVPIPSGPTSVSEGAPPVTPTPRVDETDTTELRRSTRTRTGIDRTTYNKLGTPKGYSTTKGTMGGVDTYVKYVQNVLANPPQSLERAVAYWTLVNMDPETGEMDDFMPHLTPMGLKATRQGRSTDDPTYNDALTGEHSKQFEEAMTREIRELEGRDAWTGVLRSSVPKGIQIVPLTWVFKIKRLPNGDLDKFKARICVRGDLQKVTDECTYAPVVKWPTIRSVLAFAIKNNLCTRQIDFANAFVQGKLPKDKQVYCQVPKGWGYYDDNMVLKLNRGLYGMVQSPLYWFSTVKASFIKLGYRQSKYDQCLFINDKKKTIALLYTDDCLCFGYSNQDLDELVEGLRKYHDLDDKNKRRDVYEYLGIELNTIGNSVQLLQEGLTNKILRTVGMDNCTSNETPAKEEPLSPDTDGEPFDEEWDYASVVGMLMYLVNTRPDIQFAVHQCSKYSSVPRASHANAVRKICRYLQGTRKRGITFKNKMVDSTDLRIDCYVDASFAPRYKLGNTSEYAKSRTGYIIRIDDVPVSFASKQQTEVALSTTEAEYIALSTAMRELLWIRRLVDDIATGLSVKYDRVARIKKRIISSVYEDNTAAIAIAKRPDFTPRTRHLHTKYHHFKDQLGINNDGTGIVLEHIATEDQIADIFTKGLGNMQFVKLRDLLMGWICETPTDEEN